MSPARWLRWICWLVCLVLVGSIAWDRHQVLHQVHIDGEREAGELGRRTAAALEAELAEFASRAETLSRNLAAEAGRICDEEDFGCEEGRPVCAEGDLACRLLTCDWVWTELTRGTDINTLVAVTTPDRAGCRWFRTPTGTVMGGLVELDAPLEGAATSARPGWFDAALERGAHWFEPTWGDREALEVGYAVPFDVPGSEVRGVLALPLDLESLASVEALDLQSRGFAVLLDSQQRHLVHHNPDLVISGEAMTDWARREDNEPLLELAAEMERGEPFVREVHFSATGQSSWVSVQSLAEPDWSLHVVLPQQELFQHQRTSQLEAQQILAIGLLAIVSLVIGFIGPRSGARGAWIVSGGSALCIAACIGFLWQLAATEHGFDAARMQRISDGEALEDLLEEHDSATSEPIRRVPTGVFLQSLEFLSANNVHVSGYLWQEHGGERKDTSPPFVLPEAIGPTVAPAYEVDCAGDDDDCAVSGWHISATLRQPFDYRRYPFDQKAVWIRIWPEDFASNTVLVPRLEDYGPQIPMTRPGVEQDLVPEGWTLQGSFFGYRSHSYNTDFGIPDYVGQEGFPELHYTVLLQRNLVDAFISHLVPLLVVAGLLFTVLLQGVRDELSSTDLVGICSGLFFVVLLSHTALREELATPDVVYLEYFYLLMYIFILAVAVFSVIWASRGEGSRAQRWARPLRLAFWPALMGSYLLVTWIALGLG